MKNEKVHRGKEEMIRSDLAIEWREREREREREKERERKKERERERKRERGRDGGETGKPKGKIKNEVKKRKKEGGSERKDVAFYLGLEGFEKKGKEEK